jgi:hypothetical protein
LAVEAVSEKVITSIDDFNDRAWLGAVVIFDVGTKDPNVTLADALKAFFSNDDGLNFRHGAGP